MPAALYVIAAGATGQISGTPTTPGTYTLKVTVTDSATPPDSATITYLIEVAP
jgi:PKD repeat protein